MIDLLGHFGYIFVFVGLYLLGLRKTSGWLVKAVGDGMWLGVGCLLGMSSIIVWCSVFLVLDIVGWSTWRSENKPKQFIDELGL